MAFELVIIILSTIIQLIVITLVLIFRLVVSLVVIILLFLRTIFDGRWGVILIGAGIIFGVGLLATEFQEETMIGVDIVWECGITRAAQVIASSLESLVRLPYEFIAEQWNKLVLFVIDAVTQIIDDILMLIKIGEIAGGSQLFEDVKKEIFTDGTEIGETIKGIFRIIRDGFIAVGNIIACAVDLFVQFGTSIIITSTIFNQDCTFCALDPANFTNNQALGTEFECALREPFPNRAEPDCFECSDFIAFLLSCIGAFIDDIAGSIIPINIERLARATACIINSAIKPAFWILQGLIDFAINGNCVDIVDLPEFIFDWFLSSDCGKPDPETNCMLPPDGTDLPIGIIPCWNEFLQALTNDALNDFFELIFAAVFPFIQAVIDSVVGIVECFGSTEFSECLDNFPADGTPGVTPGVCAFDPELSFPENLVPVGGIGDCFSIVGQCLDDPENITLLIPLVESGILEVLFDDFWRFTIDFTVCPFVGIGICFADVPPCAEGNFSTGIGIVDGFNDIICGFVCLEQIPILAPVADIIVDILVAIATALQLIFEFIRDIIQPILDVFDCLAECDFDDFLDFTFVGCFSGNGCSRRRNTLPSDDESLKPENVTEIRRREWHTFLFEENIYNDTMCGKLLHNYIPSEINDTDLGKYVTYWGCLAVIAAVEPWKKKCDPNLVDIGGLFGVETFQVCWDSLALCRNEYYSNRSHFYHRESMSNDEFNRIVKNSPILSKMDTFSQMIKKDIKPKIVTMFSDWSVYRNIILPLWYQFKSGPLYSLTVEFGMEWKKVKHNYVQVYDEYDRYLNKSEKALQMTNKNEQLYIPSLREIQRTEQKDLENLYMTFFNTFMWNYREASTHKSRMERHRFIKANRNQIGELILFNISSQGNAPTSLVQYQAAVSSRYFTREEYNPLTMEDLKRKQEAFMLAITRIEIVKAKISNNTGPLIEIFKVINKRYNLDHWPSVQNIAAILSMLRYKDYNGFWQWIKNEKGYLIGEGFVEKQDYEKEMNKRDIEHKGSMLDLMVGNYSLKTRRVYRPFFPISAESSPSLSPWPKNATENLLQLHTDYQQKRKERIRKGFSGTIRANSIVVGDINQIIYDIGDAIVSLFSSSETPVNDAVDDIIDFFDDLDLEELITDNFTDFLEDYFACALPENIDGTELFSPWCLGFLPENLFTLIELTPNSVFPLQIQWPEELIREDCINIYTGNNSLFFFEISDNCLPIILPNNMTNDDERTFPFCDECDHCRRNYGSCNVATCTFQNGTRIDADQLCDLVGGEQNGNGLCEFPPNSGNFIPVGELCENFGGSFQAGFGDIFDTLFYFLGVLPGVVEEFFTGGIPVKDIEALLDLVFGLIAYPFVLSIIGIPVVVILLGTILHLPTWTIAAIFGDIAPWGMFLLLGLILLLTFFTPVSAFLGVITGILILITMIWVLTLFTGVPDISGTANIIQLLIDFFELLNKNVLFFWVDFEPLIQRLEQFNFGSGPIPGFDTFCFFWTFSNIALLVITVFLGVFLFRLLYRWIIIFGIYILQLFLIILDTRRKWRLWDLEKDMTQVQDITSARGESIFRIQTTIAKLSSKIGLPYENELSSIIIGSESSPESVIDHLPLSASVLEGEPGMTTYGQRRTTQRIQKENQHSLKSPQSPPKKHQKQSTGKVE